jgi:hypothetical protein
MAMENKAVLATLTVCALLISLAITIVVSAQSIPTPSVPEFTVKYVDKSHNVPTSTTSTIDPYTNRTTIITQPGYYVQYGEVDLTIKNQPFPESINGNISNLWYDVQSYGHFANWTETYPQIQSPEGLNFQSNSEYTMLNFSGIYPPGNEIDFRVRAILGYTYRHYFPGHLVPVYSDEFVYASSNWSSAQTITVPEATPSPTAPTSYLTPHPTIEPTQTPNSTINPTLAASSLPLILAIAAFVLAIVAVAISVLVYFKKIKK